MLIPAVLVRHSLVDPRREKQRCSELLHLGLSRGNLRLSLFFFFLIFIQYHNNSNIRSIDELVMVHFRFSRQSQIDLAC